MNKKIYAAPEVRFHKLTIHCLSGLSVSENDDGQEGDEANAKSSFGVWEDDIDEEGSWLRKDH